LPHKKYVKSTMLPHHNIHKDTCTSRDGKQNQIDHFLIKENSAFKYSRR